MAYSRLDDAENSQTMSGELLRRAAELGASEVLATKPGEWRVLRDLQDLPVPVRVLEDDRFLCSEAEFAAWAEGRKQLRMEWFYRDMRRKTGLMMEGDQPAGGQWNFDHDNRKPAKAGFVAGPAPGFAPRMRWWRRCWRWWRRRFPHFGRLRPFRWATDRAGALAALAEFVAERLPRFGEEQDAMLEGEAYLSHAVISPYLNIGLLGPMEVCRAVEAAWKAGKVPIQAAEGFIRQVIGWREYVRGIWALKGPAYLEGNALGHSRALAGGLLGWRDGDGLHEGRRGADAGSGLCSSYPAADGDGEFCSAGGGGPGGGA